MGEDAGCLGRQARVTGGRAHQQVFAACACLFSILAAPALAASQDLDTLSPPRSLLSASELFALAEEARERGDVATAESAYQALSADADVRIANEARFRLGMMLAGQGRLTAAALLFRNILDAQPNAQRVRLELARVLERMGDEAGARRALREAQAGGLPPQVARFVDLYSQALRARRPFGASFELALAPDSNINRATRSDTLGTVLGDFTLDEASRQQSGIGIALRGQAYGRVQVVQEANLLIRASGAADVYRDSTFSDLALAVSAGPELEFGRDRGTAEVGILSRWIGGVAYSSAATLTLTYLHPMDRQSQLRATAQGSSTTNMRNRLQSGLSYGLSLSYERALSARAGIAASVAIDRQDLRDPGYSTTMGRLSLSAYRDFGVVTGVASFEVAHLEADRRLFIFPDRRREDFYRGSLGATFRQLTLWGFAPLVRLSYERNKSSIEIYDYSRVRTELGVARAF